MPSWIRRGSSQVKDKNDNKRLNALEPLGEIFRKHLIHKPLIKPKKSMVSLRMSQD
jgi:hypothetical protein